MRAMKGGRSHNSIRGGCSAGREEPSASTNERGGVPAGAAVAGRGAGAADEAKSQPKQANRGHRAGSHG